MQNDECHNQDILCPTFGYYVKHEKISPTFYASNASITQFKKKKIKKILITMSKMRNEGIAYNGPIILWWKHE